MKKKYGKDSSVSSGQVARALAAQCALPANLVQLEGLKEESFLDQIDSGLLMKDKIQSISKDRDTHLDSSLKLSARVEQLIKQEEEHIVTIQQLQADLARVEDTAFVITRSIDAYQNLDDEEEVAVEARILSEGVQDPAMVCALRL
ncbi:hypothetical protein JCGZ_20033 [Jatropha curcas]|uniref:Uncharacterized protein n=1 Tax=Jatropha curcas TaxID=180498 RepID=A0A067LAV2_JATCU|nr:hypothetical protein JCGZ_20033 [Jatropha curcas]